MENTDELPENPWQAHEDDLKRRADHEAREASERSIEKPVNHYEEIKNIESAMRDLSHRLNGLKSSKEVWVLVENKPVSMFLYPNPDGTWTDQYYTYSSDQVSSSLVEITKRAVENYDNEAVAIDVEIARIEALKERKYKLSGLKRKLRVNLFRHMGNGDI
jgi:DNA repair ATPase RecN